jgi:hypothetical protein
MTDQRKPLSIAGKATVATALVGFIVLAFVYVIGTQRPVIEMVSAQEFATTSVTVLNTPPSWSVDAQEQTESSIANPTNVGSNVTWVATGIDANAENYFLLICKSSTTPTANSNAGPYCGGGLPSSRGATTTWAVSATTTSGVQATAATTTTVSATEFLEQNFWVAWICDANAINPRCNSTYKEGTGNTASPFVVNHRPTFTAFIDNSPTLPGAIVTFYSTSSDPDIFGGQDTVKIFVCKAADFTGSDCGAGGTWATSTLYASDPRASTTISISPPTQDGNYGAYGYVVDEHGFPAINGSQASSSVLTVANATPTLSPATISLNDTDGSGSLILMNDAAETPGFYVQFTVTDNNSCVANASTTNEIASTSISVYRSGVTQASCQIASHYNAASCYSYGIATSSPSTWNPVCTQVSGSCDGPTDPTSIWRCTFPLWYVADPTDGANLTDSTWWAEEWKASALAIDDNFATSTFVEGTSGNEVQSLLAYALNTTSIAYGALEPGQKNDPIVQTTRFSATGNVGLDQTLFGLDMCTTFPTCTGNPTSTIQVWNQVFATSSVSYATASSTGPLTYNPGVELDLNVKKSTSTTIQAFADTFWGINIPSAITLAGDYVGQNTFIGVKGEAQQW